MSNIPELTLIPSITALYCGEPRAVFVGRTGHLLVQNDKGGVMRVSSARVRLQTAEGKHLSMKQAVELATEIAPHTRPLAPKSGKTPAAPAKSSPAKSSPVKKAGKKAIDIQYVPPNGYVVAGETLELDHFTYSVCEYNSQRYIAVGLPIEDAEELVVARTPRPEPTLVAGMTAEVEGRREAVLKGEDGYVYQTAIGKYRLIPKGSRYFTKVDGLEFVVTPEAESKLTQQHTKKAVSTKLATDVCYICPTGTAVSGQTIVLEGISYAVYETNDQRYINIGLPIEDAKAYINEHDITYLKTVDFFYNDCCYYTADVIEIDDHTYRIYYVNDIPYISTGLLIRDALALEAYNRSRPAPTPVPGMTAEVNDRREEVYKREDGYFYKNHYDFYHRFPKGTKHFTTVDGMEFVVTPATTVQMPMKYSDRVAAAKKVQLVHPTRGYSTTRDILFGDDYCTVYASNGKDYIEVGIPLEDAEFIFDANGSNFITYIKTVEFIPPTGTVVEGETVELDGFTYAVCEVDGKKYIAVGLPLGHAKALATYHRIRPAPTPVTGMTAVVKGRREAVYKRDDGYVYKTSRGEYCSFPDNTKYYTKVHGVEFEATPEARTKLSQNHTDRVAAAKKVELICPTDDMFYDESDEIDGPIYAARETLELNGYTYSVENGYGKPYITVGLPFEHAKFIRAAKLN